MNTEQPLTDGEDESMNKAAIHIKPAPELAQLDLISHQYIGDPAGTLRQARASDPVFYSEKMSCWVYTRYADIRAALMDFATY